MEKIWIITFDEVCDFESYSNKPLAFRDETTARTTLQQYKEGMKEDYAFEINKDGWTYEEGGDWAEVFSDSYAQDHYGIRLYCLEVK